MCFRFLRVNAASSPLFMLHQSLKRILARNLTLTENFVEYARNQVASIAKIDKESVTTDACLCEILNSEIKRRLECPDFNVSEIRTNNFVAGKVDAQFMERQKRGINVCRRAHDKKQSRFKGCFSALNTSTFSNRFCCMFLGISLI